MATGDRDRRARRQHTRPGDQACGDRAFEIDVQVMLRAELSHRRDPLLQHGERGANAPDHEVRIGQLRLAPRRPPGAAHCEVLVHVDEPGQHGHARGIHLLRLGRAQTRPNRGDAILQGVDVRAEHFAADGIENRAATEHDLAHLPRFHLVGQWRGTARRRPLSTDPLSNRVGTGLIPAPPTPPGVRVRTGRFALHPGSDGRVR